MVHKRHPQVASHIVETLSNHPSTPCQEAVVQAGEGLHAFPGFTPPSWHELTLGAKQPPRNLRRTSQEPLAPVLHERTVSTTTMSDSERAMVPVPKWPCSWGFPFTVCGTCFETWFVSPLFRTLLLRRLRLPLSSAKRICKCGRPLDSRGHHRAACAMAGVLGRRGFAVGSAAARVCREGGARVCQRHGQGHAGSDRYDVVFPASQMRQRPMEQLSELQEGKRSGLVRSWQAHSPGRAGWGGGIPLVKGYQQGARCAMNQWS